MGGPEGLLTGSDIMLSPNAGFRRLRKVSAAWNVHEWLQILNESLTYKVLLFMFMMLCYVSTLVIFLGLVELSQAMSRPSRYFGTESLVSAAGRSR